MKVKDVIDEALRLVGRYDVADAAESDALPEEALRLKRACLTYLNAVVDELARGYFPLRAVDELSGENGKFAFASFPRTPLEIKKVFSGEKPIRWQICPDYLLADAENIRVDYRYVPAPFAETDEFVYPDFAVGERLVIYGVVSEYYLVLGDAASSAVWENKYRAEIDNLLSHSTVREVIPPRRWI